MSNHKKAQDRANKKRVKRRGKLDRFKKHVQHMRNGCEHCNRAIWEQWKKQNTKNVAGTPVHVVEANLPPPTK